MVECQISLLIISVNYCCTSEQGFFEPNRRGSFPTVFIKRWKIGLAKELRNRERIEQQLLKRRKIGPTKKLRNRERMEQQYCLSEVPIPKISFPELFSFTRLVSNIAFAQFNIPQQLIDQVPLWIKINGAIFGGLLVSSRQAYKKLIGHLLIHLVYSWLWKCSCQSKHKDFFFVSP